VNPQILTHHICFNNRIQAYTRQGKQTPNIDQRKHTETRNHQPTHTNPKNLTQAFAPPTLQWAVRLLSHVVLRVVLPQHLGSAIVPVRPPKLPCSSLRYARRGRAAHTQIQTRHICFNNRRRAATHQGKQTPIIDQRKHAETRKHQPTLTNPKT
jgi:hypothetical protein